MVSAEEFAALVADEIAHEYVWDEYQKAMARNDHQKMQQLELSCDGIAVLTLRSLGLDAEHLVSAVKKITRFNQLRGMVANASDYVPKGTHRLHPRHRRHAVELTVDAHR